MSAGQACWHGRRFTLVRGANPGQYQVEIGGGEWRLMRIRAYFSNWLKQTFGKNARQVRSLLKMHFDKEFYLSTNPEMTKSGLDPIKHYCTRGWIEGLNPRPDFDTLYYRASNPDVEKAGLNPFVHYLLHGRDEGRAPKARNERDHEVAVEYLIIAPEFDVDYYLSHNKDIAEGKIDPIKHYIDHGWKESRNPCAGFNTGYYYFRNKDVIPSGISPFRHYIEIGRQEGRSPCNQNGREPHLRLKSDFGLIDSLNVVPSLRPIDENDYCLKVPFQIETRVRSVDSVAAIIHAYYVDLLPKLLSCLKNVPFRTDLFVSTDTEAKKASILEILASYSNGTVEVRVFDNRGRNIAPLIVGFSDVLKTYDYFIHLHTKRSPHGGEPLEQWLDYLLGNLLGSKRIVNCIFTLLSDYNIGIVYPQHFFVLRGILNWGYNYEAASALLRRAGFVLDKLHLLEFPSGSMFWARSAAVRPLLDLNLQFSDFPAEVAETDGTLAHAIERTFCFFSELAGFRWAKICCEATNYPVKDVVLNTETVEDILYNLALTYRPLLGKQLSGVTTSEKTIPEVRSIIYYPSMNQRPRLNLLVPTINPAQTFGGVSTALNIFAELELLYNAVADFRVIVTDAPLASDALERFPEYKFNTLSVHDANLGHEIVDAITRNLEPLPLRQSDVFIATAWWTAHLAFEAIDAQKLLFRRANKLVYLIQDFEPNFYGWSTKWVLAENTLRRGNETIAIINSSELCHFVLKDYTFAYVYCLRYKRNEKIHLEDHAERQKIILVYGRPDVTRNLFELAIDGISLWQQRNPTLAREWQIISVGEDYARDAASQVNNFKILGKLSLEEYSLYLRTASVGISLMLSPHPSYPPLEMAEAGIVTITNSCFGKNLGRNFGNIIALDKVTNESIAEAISNAIIRAKSAAKSQPAPKIERRSFNSIGRHLKIPDVRKTQGVLNHIETEASRPVSVYNAEELGTLLELTLER
jgi:hypothetical protein